MLAKNVPNLFTCCVCVCVRARACVCVCVYCLRNHLTLNKYNWKTLCYKKKWAKHIISVKRNDRLPKVYLPLPGALKYFLSFAVSFKIPFFRKQELIKRKESYRYVFPANRIPFISSIRDHRKQVFVAQSSVSYIWRRWWM